MVCEKDWKLINRKLKKNNFMGLFEWCIIKRQYKSNFCALRIWKLSSLLLDTFGNKSILKSWFSECWELKRGFSYPNPWFVSTNQILQLVRIFINLKNLILLTSVCHDYLFFFFHKEMVTVGTRTRETDICACASVIRVLFLHPKCPRHNPALFIACSHGDGFDLLRSTLF